MMKASKFVAVFIGIVCLLLGPATASAGPPNGHSTNGPIQWTLKAGGACAAVVSDLTGNGTIQTVVNTRVDRDGNVVTTTNSVARGTASDTVGTYTFVYTNHNVDVAPADGSPNQISMVDSFVLTGNGSTPNLNVGFNWRWSYTPPNQWPPQDNWQQIATRGDPLNCDPL
jgi:hypothetical protein